jgi:carboxyl-terminal processing protease
VFNSYFQKYIGQNIRLIIASILALLVAGCSSGSSNSNSNTQAVAKLSKPETGIWTSQAYGLAADINDTDFTFYQFTRDYCQTYPIKSLLDIDFDGLIAGADVSVDGSTLKTTLAGWKVPGIVMEKQDQLPLNCIENIVPSMAEANYEFNPRQEFEIFWAAFDELYAFFELEGLNWAEIYEAASFEVTGATSQEELFSVFAAMITPLRDFHVTILNATLDIEYASPSRKPDIETIVLLEYLAINELDTISSEAELARLLEYFESQEDSALSVVINQVIAGEDIHSNDTETIVWARLEGNIGYVLLETMNDNEIGGSEFIDANLATLASTLDQVLDDLTGVEGLVIDVRNNYGGDDFVSQYIAGRLTRQSYQAYGKQARSGAVRTPLQVVSIDVKGDTQYDGPIAVLSSMSTASAAEVFTLIMRERANSVIIGESGIGGFSDQLIRTLPSGTLYTLSTEFYMSVTGEEFEGSGVPVDIEIPYFTLEQREAEQDLGLEAAIEWLMDF